MRGIEFLHQQREAVELPPEGGVRAVAFDLVAEPPCKQCGVVAVLLHFPADTLGLLRAMRRVVVREPAALRLQPDAGAHREAELAGLVENLGKAVGRPGPDGVAATRGKLIEAAAAARALDEIPLATAEHAGGSVDADRHRAACPGTVVRRDRLAACHQPRGGQHRASQPAEPRSLVGHVDELAIVPRALSDEEISRLGRCGGSRVRPPARAEPPDGNGHCPLHAGTTDPPIRSGNHPLPTHHPPTNRSHP